MAQSKSRGSSIDRRRFLRSTLAGCRGEPVAGARLGPWAVCRALSGANPFTLGVASGDPFPDGIVLWTRLAPEPANPASLGRRPIPVGWRVATDSHMRHLVARGPPWRGPSSRIPCTWKWMGFSRSATTSISSTCATMKAGSATSAQRRRRMRSCASAVRVRHVPGLAEWLLHGLSGHAAEQSRSRAPPGGLHLRVRDRRR